MAKVYPESIALFRLPQVYSMAIGTEFNPTLTHYVDLDWIYSFFHIHLVIITHNKQ